MYGDDDYAKWHKDHELPLQSWGAQGAGFFADIYPKDGSTPLDIQEAYFNLENFKKLERVQELGSMKGVP